MDIPSLFYMKTHGIKVQESMLQVQGELNI